MDPSLANGQGAKARGPSRPVVCPKCLGRYRVPLAKIPKQGAWVTCPSCAERFIIKLDDQSFNEPQAASLVQPGDVAAQGTAKGKKPHMYRLGSQEQIGELEVTVLDPITPVVRRYWGLGLFMALLLIFVAEALILRSSWRSANSMADLQQASEPAAPGAYGIDDLANDLRTLQEGSTSSRYIDRRVAYTGLESRIYKFAVSQLAPDSCQAISAVSLWSREPASGLVLNGTCLDRDGLPASVRVSWSGRYADLYLDGQDRLARLNVLLHRPTSPVAAPAVESIAVEYPAVE
jgi:predicted Zn finger-like uncharacterized protein